MSTDADSQDRRSCMLRALGADDEVRDELLAYNDNRFDHSRITANSEWPLPDELHVDTWRLYVEQARDAELISILLQHLVQLQFPVRAGISDTDEYRSATRRGVPTESIASATGLKLQAPDMIRLMLHCTPAGTIPVLIAAERADFVALVQALTKRNEPVPIPDSMGALMVAGYNNWGRVNVLRRKWQKDHPEDFSGASWSREFKNNVIPHKQLYQDKFIILSRGPYSGVAAADMKLTDDEWLEISLTIRLEHECAHYFTRRVFGSMQNNLLDELIADYQGIVSATGRFRADWFLRFLGLENPAEHRRDGRLEIYRGSPPLSDRAFEILQQLVRRAARNLEQIDQQHRGQLDSLAARARFLTALTRLTLEELASDDALHAVNAVIEGAL